MARISRHFVPCMLDAGHLAAGHRLLDVATGTGLVAEAALDVVGPTGHVTAVDISPGMIEQARRRLGGAANVTTRVEDGQAMSFADTSFDTVRGLMFFAGGRSQSIGLRGGYAAVSVNTVPEHSYNTRVHAYIARYDPRRRPGAHSGDEAHLRTLFALAFAM